MTDNELRQLLNETKTIAVVGLSNRPERPSYHVAAYLREQGYHIIPVNPTITEFMGERAYSTLRDVPIAVAMVDVFRRPDAVPEVVRDAIAIGAKSIWLQEGVIHEAAAAEARAAGLKVVMDKCILKEHQRIYH
jgi:predicted CoA-binding protein